MSTQNPQPAHAGDAGEERIVILSGVADLTTASSASATVTHQETGTSADLDASVTDAATNEVTVELGTWLSDGPATGKWNITVEVGFADGSSLTWPAVGQGWDVLMVL